MQRRQLSREIELEAVKLFRDRGATRAQAAPDLRSAFPRKSRSLFDLGSTTPREELDVRVGNTHDATRFLAARMPLQGPHGAVAVSRSESRTWLGRAPSPRTRSNEDARREPVRQRHRWTMQSTTCATRQRRRHGKNHQRARDRHTRVTGASRKNAYAKTPMEYVRPPFVFPLAP